MIRLDARHIAGRWIAALAALGPVAGAQVTSISTTKHNLSTSGPGPFKAQSEGRICVFCHAPHKARTVTPLWNREDSRATYLTYQSTTFQGTVSQPNGSTKLCLSCHDGTIALGKIVSMSQEIQMATGHRFLDAGASFLGTNLRDDHPLSFHYASSKGGSGTDYRLPSAILSPVRLDDAGQVQCTSCHDPHDDSRGGFLRTTDRSGALCLSCHAPSPWPTASHALSTSTWNGMGADPWPGARYASVAENACQSCHEPHAAERPARLLRFALDEDNCLRCHNGNVANEDIATDVAKPSAHSPAATNGVHDPTENVLTMARHAECQDCHDPHAARGGSVAAPGVPGPLTNVGGLDSSGNPVGSISFGFELCYKCHADRNGGTIRVPRVIQQANVRLEFSASSPSFHPIEATGKNSDVPSLIPPWTTASRVACTDCHSSNTSPGFGGSRAAGPHGSIYTPLLGANYTTADNTTESAQAFALCYTCHSRTSILNDVSFKEHKKHIVKENAPCSACHDSHGISSTQGTAANNSHLINFDSQIVSASPNQGKLEFLDLGTRSGQCTLLCHGQDHKPKKY